MTWQRIDENTYIDDTLVTCAEYQLFIDEMLEQGKYYQPDHWKSYQFLAGTAREPILGVRSDDAITFCDWLTRRVSQEWLYQLPNKGKFEKFLLRSVCTNPVGYWVIEKNKPHSTSLISSRNQKRDVPIFTWAGPIPEDARKLVVTQQPNDLWLQAFNRARNHPLIIDEKIANLASKVDHVVAIAGDLMLAINPILARDRLRGINNAIERTRTLALSLDHNANIFARGDLMFRYEEILDLYVDIFTLRERIAGHSPAFEGIRLVKERIR